MSQKRVVAANVRRGDTGEEGHFSAEVTPHANTEFMNNRAQGMRAAVRDETLGIKSSPSSNALEMMGDV